MVQGVQEVREVQEVPKSGIKDGGKTGVKSCVLTENFKIKLKRNSSSQLVQFHQCDHEVQEVQWVQEVHSCHPYQQHQKLQQVPIFYIKSLNEGTSV